VPHADEIRIDRFGNIKGGIRLNKYFGGEFFDLELTRGSRIGKPKHQQSQKREELENR
jgi:hypothetical protein